MKVYLLWDKKESKYIEHFWRRKGAAKAYVTYQSLLAEDVLDNKRTFLKADDLHPDFVEYVKQHPNRYIKVKYQDQTRYECREMDIVNAPYEVV